MRAARAMMVASQGALGDPYWSNVVALFLADDQANNSTTITDSSPVASNPTANGTAKISTSSPKYGPGCIAFDGTTNSYLSTTADSTNFVFGTSDFTIEMWLFFNSTTQDCSLLDMRPVSTSGSYVTLNAATGAASVNLEWVVNGGATTIATGLAATRWYHLAVARSGSTRKTFIDGTQANSSPDSSNYTCPSGTGRPFIGANARLSPVQFTLNGKLDDLRITKGAARYTSSFTPPTATLPTRGWG